MGKEEKKPEEKKMEEKKPEEEKKEEKKAEVKPAEEKKEEAAKDGKESKEAKEEAPPPPPPPQEIVLKVDLHCKGCAREVRRCLKGFEGVEDVKTDWEISKVVVKGEKADPLKVLERVQRKRQKSVELISPIPKPKTEEEKKSEEAEKPKPEEKKEEPQIITVVLKVEMHCEACAQKIKKRILKMKGVESAEPDLKSSELIVKGVFDPPKLVEYVYQRTGKHAVIVKQEPEKKDKEESKDELQNLNKHEIFLSVKRHLAVATRATHVAEEWVDQAFRDLKEEESKRCTAQKSQALTDKKLKETLLELAECDKDRKSAEASIESTERQAREQLLHLREAESQLAIARTTISELKKVLSQKDEEMNKVKQTAYNQGQKETEARLKSQFLLVCCSFCLQTWNEALDAAGVDPNSELRKPENVFYPPQIRAHLVSQSSVSTSAPTSASSIENPQPKSSTTAPAQSKPTEQKPSTIAPAKPKQTEPAVSKPSAAVPQSIEVAAKAPLTAGDSTIVPTTTMAPSAPTSIAKVQPTTGTGTQKTPKV